MIIGYLIGVAIALSAFGMVLALLMSLGNTLVLKEPMPFKTRFWISVGSLLATFAIRWALESVFGQAPGPYVVNLLPVIALVGVTWLLVTRYLNSKSGPGEGNVGKGLLVALIQLGGFVVVGLVILVGFIALIRR